MYEFGVASSGIKFISNFVKVHLKCLELKHEGEWMDRVTEMTIPTCSFFLYTVQRSHNKGNKTAVKERERESARVWSCAHDRKLTTSI
jgi:hypothetical protein